MPITDNTYKTLKESLCYGTAGTRAAAAGAAMWSVVNQMSHSTNTLVFTSIRVDISGAKLCTQLTVRSQGKPVLLCARTKDEIARARATPLSDLPDQKAQNANLAGDANANGENRALSEDGVRLVQMEFALTRVAVLLEKWAGFAPVTCRPMMQRAVLA